MAILPISTKQDRGGVRTAAELERKYDLSLLVGVKEAQKNSIEALNRTNAILEQFMIVTLDSLEALKNQIDGNIQIWFYEGNPKNDNLPASEWITEEVKKKHVGDLYYNKKTGTSYKYIVEESEFCWGKIEGNEVSEALAVANAAADTLDNMRRVFTEQPITPYDNGDLWFKDGEIFVCQISKATDEEYAEKDFVIAKEYTSGTYAKQIGDVLTIIKGSVATIRESADKIEWMIESGENSSSIVLTDNMIAAVTDKMAITSEDGSETIIEGGKIKAKSISAKEINVEDLFAQNIDATGSVSGATIISESDTGKIVLEDGAIKIYTLDRRGEGGWIEIGQLYAASSGEVGTIGGWVFENVSTVDGADLDEVAEKINKKNVYETDRQTITLSTANQTIEADGLLYGQITANSNSNVIIWVNNVPRSGIRMPSTGSTSLTFSIDVVEGDKVRYSVYNSGVVDSCYLYLKP